MTIIPLKDIPPVVKQFLDMPAGIEKNVLYKTIKYECNQMVTSSILLEDGKIMLNNCLITIIRTKHSYYLRKSKRSGLTLDSNGKLLIWYKHLIQNIPFLKEFINYMKIDWFEYDKLHLWLTKATLEKILNNKLTNPIDFLSVWLKNNRIKASPKLLYNEIKNNNNNLTPYRFRELANVTDNIDLWLLNSTRRYPHLTDICEQAFILNRKIKFNWSDERFEKEHREMTRVIMGHELKCIDIKKAKFNDMTELFPSEFKLLDTNKKVFEEGTIMDHCLYTNYWNSIASGNYIAFHINFNEEHATLGLICRFIGKNPILIFDQCYLKRNKPVSNELNSYVHEVLRQVNNSHKMLKMNQNTSDLRYVEVELTKQLLVPEQLLQREYDLRELFDNI